MVLAIYGAGGMGGEFLDLAQKINRQEKRWDEILFVDDNHGGETLCELPVYTLKEAMARFKTDEIEFTISVGEPSTRELMANKVKEAGFSLATLICPRSNPLPYGIVIEEGAVIMSETADIGSFAHIGKNVLVQLYSIVGHNTSIGDNTNVSCFAMISGLCTIGRNVFLGTSCVVKEKTTIGDNAIIGMCAPVHRDVPANYTVFHTPSKMVPHDVTDKVFQSKYLG